MKTLTIKVSDRLAAELDVEARERRISKSDVVRERLERGSLTRQDIDPLADIRDLIGSVVDDLPEDLSGRTEEYLKETGYGVDSGRRHRISRRAAAKS